VELLEPLLQADAKSVGLAKNLAMAYEFAGIRRAEMGEMAGARRDFARSLELAEGCWRGAQMIFRRMCRRWRWRRHWAGRWRRGLQWECERSNGRSGM